MQRNHRAIARLYWIDAAIQRGEHPNATGLARDLGVSPSTVLTDLGRLREEFRAPITYDPVRRGFAYRRRFIPDLPRIDAGEAIDLARALTRSGSITGSALQRSLAALLDSIAELLPDLETAGSPNATAPEATHSSAEERLSLGSHAAARNQARARIRGGASAPNDAPISVTLRFDSTAGPEILRAGLLRREEVQFLTDGGLETTLMTRDPDALLLELVRWAPNFEVKTPPWMRRRLTVLLRRLLKQAERRSKKSAHRNRAPSKSRT